MNLHLAILLMKWRKRRQQNKLEQNVIKKKNMKPKRRIWCRSWLQRRIRLGCYENLLSELSMEDRPGYRNFLRIDKQIFCAILEKIRPKIEKKDTWYRKALEPGLKLAITLRFLATGDYITKNLILHIDIKI